MAAPLLSLLAACCADATLDPRTFAVFVVDARRPEGATPMAYLHPEGEVRDDTVLVYRAVGAEQAARHRNVRHRLALWADAGVPDLAVPAMIRHEVEHARRWERSGGAFFEADGMLRAAVSDSGGSGYSRLPSEVEANLAAAAFVRRTMGERALRALAAIDETGALVAAVPTADDVVESTLAQLASLPDPDGEVGLVAQRARAGCRAWDEAQARMRLACDGPVLESA